MESGLLDVFDQLIMNHNWTVERALLNQDGMIEEHCVQGSSM